MVKWLKIFSTIILILIPITYLDSLYNYSLNLMTNECSKMKYGYQTHKHQKVLFSTDSQTTTYDKKTFFEHLSKKSNKIFLINCNFYHCKHNSLMIHGSNGGAVLLNAIIATIDHCKFRNNYAAHNGGAAYIQSSSIIRITDSIFVSNTAGNFCGGLFLFNIFNNIITYSNFSNNAAKEASSFAAIYCRNCATKNLIFYRNKATDNGTIFIERSKITDEKSIFLENFARVASSVRLSRFSESSFYNTEFFDKIDVYSIVSTDSDILKFENCVFSREFKNEIQNNSAKVTETGTIVKSHPTHRFVLTYSPVPTYPPLQSPNLTTPTEKNDVGQSNRNEHSNSAYPAQWKSIIIFLYIFFIIMLIYVLANHFSWFSKHSPRSSPHFSSGSRFIRRSRSNISLS